MPLTAPAYPLGPIGLWTREFERLPHLRVKDLVAEIEALGWRTLWTAETVGRESFTSSTLLLAASQRLVIATGITTIWGRDPLTAAAAHKTITEAYPERFVLGLGVSHPIIVEGERRQRYTKPLAAMSAYLDAMDSATYRSVLPTTPLRRVLAALGPRMLALSADRADGAHSYLVTPEHTAQARLVLGQGPVLAPEQMVVLETDPATARMVARAHLGRYLAQPNYQRNLLRLGFAEEDLQDGGTDRIVDALVAWGDEGDVTRRVQAHRDAGADHVCIQPLAASGVGFPMHEVRRLAAALLPSTPYQSASHSREEGHRALPTVVDAPERNPSVGEPGGRRFRRAAMIGRPADGTGYTTDDSESEP